MPHQGSSRQQLILKVNIPLSDGGSERCGDHACVQKVTRESFQCMIL